VVSNNFSEYIIKLTSAPTTIATALASSGTVPAPGVVGGFVPKYLTDDSKYISAVTVNNDDSVNPTSVTFVITPVGGVVSTAYVSTNGHGHNALPFAGSSVSTSITLTFGAGSYAEYASTGAFFFLTVKWQ